MYLVGPEKNKLSFDHFTFIWCKGKKWNKIMEIYRQINLFGEVDPKTLSIEDSAKRIGVSTATIRNWIKTGYLIAAGRGQVSLDSFEKFQTEVAGIEKLTKRANKSFKDEHDHFSITDKIIEKLRFNNIDFKSLGSEYESRLSDSYRNREGIYYTPENIVCDLFKNPAIDIDRATFCDPCCGSGNFVSHALSLGFKPENIYAFDTDPVAVEITKKRIFQESGFENPKVENKDFLELAVSTNPPSYDCIYTNPPWGKKFNKEKKRKIGRILGAEDSLDTCSLFFFASLKCLKENGESGLLLPEAFFNISTYEFARIRALEYVIKRLIDYGKPFRGLVTKAQGIVLLKNKKNSKSIIECSDCHTTFERSVLSFRTNPKSILNLYCSQEDAEVISHIFSLPHITLKNHAKWGLGIVTGNNEKFVKNEQNDGLIPVFKGADITKSGLKEPSSFIPDDFSLYQQVAPLELYRVDEKLIYKFISSKLCFFHDTQQQFILNSANMLIPESSFPISTKVLCGLLNSGLMNWLFSCLFNTHKILRGDLESLPIHSQFLDGDLFDEEEYLFNLKIQRISGGTFRIKE